MKQAIDHFLRSLRVSGSILISETYAAPWAIAIPEASRLGAVLGADSWDHILIFHYVCRGGFDFARCGQPTLRVKTGEMIISIAGQAHVMSDGAGAVPVDAVAILSGQISPPLANGDGGATTLICGAFMIRALPLDPLVAALPAIMKLDVNALNENHSLRQIAALLTSEVEAGSTGGFTTLRLLEIFCAQSLSLYCQEQPRLGTGWLKLIADTRLSPAILFVHEHPEDAHDIKTLAGHAALSPSRFAARFREAFGQSVMSYVTQVRMHKACHLIRDTRLSLADIAEACGYQSLPGFGRGFKAVIGQSPSAWRAQASDAKTAAAFTRRH